MEPPLLLMDVDADVVDEAIGGAARVGGTEPGRALSQIRMQLRERHAPIPVEVDKLDVAEHAVITEDVHLEVTRDRILAPVIGLTCLQDEVVQLGNIEIVSGEDFFRQARLEKLAP